MTQPWNPSPILPRSTRSSLTWVAILIVFAVSCLALVGWVLNIAPFKSIKPQWIAMRVITAICLVLAALELTIMQLSLPGRRLSAGLKAPALLVGLTGLLTIISYGIVMLTGQEPPWESAPFLNLFLAPTTRMALLTAVVFLLSGCSLMLLSAGSLRTANIAHALMLPGALVSYLVLVSYLLHVQSLHGWLNVPMALNTGLAFWVLSIAIFCIRPDTWLTKVFSAEYAGGVMARRLLPALIAIPLLLGSYHLYEEQTQRGSEISMPLMVVAYTFCLLVLLWWTTASLNRADSERNQERDFANTLLETLGALVVVLDREGRILRFNRACEQVTGYRFQEVQGKTFFDLFLLPKETRGVQQIFERLKAGDFPNTHVNHWVTRNGEPRLISWFNNALTDEQGEVTHIIGTGVDITDRQMAEEALRRQAQLLELAHEAIIVRDLDSRVTFWSRGAEATYGWKKEAVLGKVAHTLLQTQFPTSLDDIERALMAHGQWEGELTHVNAHGQIIVVDSRQSLQRNEAGEPTAFLEINRDITDRKQAEEALRQARDELEQRVQERTAQLQQQTDLLEDLYNNAPCGYHSLAPDGTFIQINDTELNWLGYTRDEVVGRLKFVDLLTPDSRETFRENFSIFLDLGWARDLEYELVRKDGTLLPVALNAMTIKDQAGNILKSRGTIFDIAKRRDAEAALRESEARFRALVMAFSDVVYRMSPDWSEMLQLRGRDFIPDTEAPSQTWLQKYIHPDDQAHVLAVINEAIRTKSIFELEHRVRRVDGSLGWTFSRAIPLLDANGEIVEWFGTASDITDRKLAEEALRVSEQRLRSLASQVISAQEAERKRIAMDLHEGLGQSMSVLKMYLRAIQRHLPKDAAGTEGDFARAQNLLKEMIEEVRRISRGLSPALLENLGLTAALQHLLDEFGKNPEVKINKDMDDIQNCFSFPIEVNLFRVFQEALTNIAKHARAKQVSVTVKRQDGKVNFLIKDNGVGFDLKQITPEKIATDGMGLAAMDERLRTTGARLNIVSQPGMGTEISFSIPCEC